MFGVRDLNKQETAEKTVNIVVDVLSSIDVQITKNDISIAHRLGEIYRKQGKTNYREI